MNCFISGVAGELLDLIFPPACLVCREKSHETICPRCRGAFEYLEDPLCSCCGGSVEVPGDSCENCLEHPPPYLLARSVFSYSGQLRQAITGMKFHGKLQLAPVLSEYLLDYIQCQRELFPGNLLIPVPSRSGSNNPGFPRFACHHIQKATGLEYREALTLRHFIPQHRLDSRGRWENARKAFAPAQGDSIKGKRVILIDDIFTSGATAYHCSRILLDQGVLSVRVLTLARTPPGYMSREEPDQP